MKVLFEADINNGSHVTSGRNTFDLTFASLLQKYRSLDLTSSIRNVPQSYKDFVLNFTREERLAMYDYVIHQTGHFEQPEATFL